MWEHLRTTLGAFRSDDLCQFEKSARPVAAMMGMSLFGESHRIGSAKDSLQKNLLEGLHTVSEHPILGKPPPKFLVWWQDYLFFGFKTPENR